MHQNKYFNLEYFYLRYKFKKQIWTQKEKLLHTKKRKFPTYIIKF